MLCVRSNATPRLRPSLTMTPDTVACTRCQKTGKLLFVARDLNRGVTTEPFPYYACAACGLVFLYPIPADLPRYYPADYHYYPNSIDELLASANVHERYKIEILRRFVPAGDVLEIGPGVGGFAVLAKQAGYRLRVIEVNERCCAFIRSTLGIDTVHTFDEVGALSREQPVDVIALWQVLEHLPDPFRLLEVAADRLKPGGTLVVAMPNPESIQFRLLGARWVHLDAPRHVVLIPQRLLLEVAARLGLEPLLVTTRDSGSIAWNRFGWEYSLPNVFPRRSRPRMMSIGRRVGRLARFVDDGEGRGSAYTAVLRKATA